jgi:hypothetical protein
MARTAIEVNKELLTKCVADAEALQTFDTQNDLWKKVAELYNATNPPKAITFSVVCLRVTQWEIPFNTKSAKGKRKGGTLSDEQKAAMKAGRESGGSRVRFSNKDAERSIALLRAKTPERFWPLVDRIAKGSRAAAQKLFCIECMGHQASEVKKCTSLGCPHYLLRPYQSGSEDEGEVTDTVEEVPEPIEIVEPSTAQVTLSEEKAPEKVEETIAES